MRFILTQSPAENRQNTKSFLTSLRVFHGVEELWMEPGLGERVSEYLGEDIRQHYRFVKIIRPSHVRLSERLATKLLAEIIGVDDRKVQTMLSDSTASEGGWLFPLIKDWFLSKSLRAPQIHVTNDLAYYAMVEVYNLAYRTPHRLTLEKAQTISKWIENSFPTGIRTARIPDVSTLPSNREDILGLLRTSDGLSEVRETIHLIAGRKRLSDLMLSFEEKAQNVADMALRDWPELGVVTSSAAIASLIDPIAIIPTLIEALGLATRWKSELEVPFTPTFTIEPGYWDPPLESIDFRVDSLTCDWHAQSQATHVELRAVTRPLK